MAHVKGMDNPPEYLHLKKWSHPRDYMGAEWPEYYVVIGRTRDSDALERSNFNSMLAALGGENEDTGVIVARATHWLVGWVETIMIHETAKEKLEIAEKLMEGLDDYAIIDEEDYSNEEQEERGEFFESGAKQDMKNTISNELGEDILEFLQEHTSLDHILWLMVDNHSGMSGETGAPDDIKEMLHDSTDVDYEPTGKLFLAALQGKTLEELIEMEKTLNPDPNQTSFKDIAPEEFKMASTLEPEDIIKTLSTTGYTDPAAMLRAQYLLGMAKDKMFGKAVKEIKLKLEKEMKDRVTRACKWGTHKLDETSVKDIIAKVLMENGIYPYPQLLAELYKNPFQNMGTVAEPTRESMQKPVTALAAKTLENQGDKPYISGIPQAYMNFNKGSIPPGAELIAIKDTYLDGLPIEAPQGTRVQVTFEGTGGWQHDLMVDYQGKPWHIPPVFFDAWTLAPGYVTGSFVRAAGAETLVEPTDTHVSDQWMSNPDYPSLITETMDATIALELETSENLPSSLTVENILIEIDERKDRFEQIIGGQLSEDDKMAIIDDIERDYLDHIDLIRSMASKKNA